MANRIKWCLVAILSSAPSVMADVPATQPAAGNVMVVPFKSIGDASHEWAGRGVEQNLLADLARANLKPASTQGDFPDTATALSVADKAGVQYVIVGAVQATDQQLRVNGQIYDTKTNKIVGGLSATGNERDLFALEDSVSAQAIKALDELTGVAPATVAPVAARAGKPVAAALQLPAVAAVVQPPAAVASAGGYDGSDLQRYVDSNRTPSVDYQQQVQDLRNRSTFGSYNNGFGGYYGGYGLGGFSSFGGFPFGGYGFPVGYGGNLGGFGRGGFGNGGFGRGGIAFGGGGRHGQFSAR